MRPKAFGILQEKILQYLAWREVRQEQVKVQAGLLEEKRRTERDI